MVGIIGYRLVSSLMECNLKKGDSGMWAHHAVDSFIPNGLVCSTQYEMGQIV